MLDNLEINVHIASNKNIETSSKKSMFFAFFICLVIAFIAITIVSKCSFLYAFHDGNDVNWFLTMGRGIVEGKVPYRDLFEQKGILLYMLFALNYLICGDQLYFIYLVEIIFGASFLFLSFKIINLYLPYKSSLLGVLITAIIVFTSRAFWCGGGEAEEYCLPLFTYEVYIFLKSLKKDKNISLIEGFICGLFAGVIFWIKYSMLVFYAVLGLCIFIDFFIKKKAPKAIFFALFFILGMMLISVPMITYLGMNQALDDMWNIYILFNIFGYAEGRDFLTRITELLVALGQVPLNFFLYIMIVFSLIYMWKVYNVNLRYKIYYSVLILFTFLIQCLIMGNIGYYHLVMAAFVPFGIVALPYCFTNIIAFFKALFVSKKEKTEPFKNRFEIAYENSDDAINKFLNDFNETKEKKNNIKVISISIFALISTSLLFGNNTIELFYSKSYYPQILAKEIIESYGKEDYSLLTYKMFDRGFYTVCDQTPKFYYFAQNLVSEESYPQLFEEQESYVINGEADFVVTELSTWEKEKADDQPLAKYEYVADLSYVYIRSNLDRLDLKLCLLAIKQ